MTNLLQETIAALRHPEDQVLWVGSSDGKYAISWDDFAKIAADTEYDAGYGGAEIAIDLVVVGNGWWLERGEYDGSEWWEFKKQPVADDAPAPFMNVSGRNWQNIEELQK